MMTICVTNEERSVSSEEQLERDLVNIREELEEVDSKSDSARKELDILHGIYTNFQELKEGGLCSELIPTDILRQTSSNILAMYEATSSNLQELLDKESRLEDELFDKEEEWLILQEENDIDQVVETESSMWSTEEDQGSMWNTETEDTMWSTEETRQSQDTMWRIDNRVWEV